MMWWRVEVSSEKLSLKFVVKIRANYLFVASLRMFLPHIVLPEDKSWLFRSVAKNFTKCLIESQFPKHSKSSVLSQFQSDPLEICFGNNSREFLVRFQQYYRISSILKQTDFSKSCPDLWKSFFLENHGKTSPDIQNCNSFLEFFSILLSSKTPGQWG